MEVMPFGKPLAAKPYQGWPVPRANHVRVDWKLNNHATTVSSRVVYRTPGPCFVGVATAQEIDRWLPSERLGLESKLGQKALQIVQEQVREHNAVVQPVDNGPEDLVYLAETQYRVDGPGGFRLRIAQADDRNVILPDRVANLRGAPEQHVDDVERM